TYAHVHIPHARTHTDTHSHLCVKCADSLTFCPALLDGLERAARPTHFTHTHTHTHTHTRTSNTHTHTHTHHHTHTPTSMNHNTSRNTDTVGTPNQPQK